MTFKEFKELAKKLNVDDNTEIIIHNDSCEWYGTEPITKRAWSMDISKNELILEFGACG